MKSEILKKAGQTLIKYFFRGILIVLPVMATIYVIYWLFTHIDTMLDFKIPGIGILVILGGIIAIGYLGSGLVLKPILDIFDDILERTPGVKVVYSAVKDFLEAFVGEKRKFNEPVMVQLTEDGIYRLGFVTQKDLSKLGIEGFVAVYFPLSYTFSGQLFLVPYDKIKPVEGNPSDVMKFIVTGGVTEMDNKKV